MKSLIKDSSVEQFKMWAESVLSLATKEETGFHKGEDRSLLITHMTESEVFKYYLHTGFEAYLVDAEKIFLGSYGNPDNLPVDKVLECLHHDRVTAGFMMGFKYAMYLHEQRELAQYNTPDEHDLDYAGTEEYRKLDVQLDEQQ